MGCWGGSVWPVVPGGSAGWYWGVLGIGVGLKSGFQYAVKVRIRKRMSR